MNEWKEVFVFLPLLSQMMETHILKIYWDLLVIVSHLSTAWVSEAWQLSICRSILVSFYFELLEHGVVLQCLSFWAMRVAGLVLGFKYKVCWSWNKVFREATFNLRWWLVVIQVRGVIFWTHETGDKAKQRKMRNARFTSIILESRSREGIGCYFFIFFYPYESRKHYNTKKRNEIRICDLLFIVSQS